MRFRDGEDGAAGGGGAAVAHAPDVGAEHVGKSGHGGGHGVSLVEDVGDGPSLRGGWDGDGSAVHVHFAIADLVEPGPGQGVVRAGGNGVGDREGEFVGSEAERVGAHVAGVGGRTASLDGLDDFEDRVFGGWSIGRQ